VFEHLTRCGQLGQADLEAALASREACQALLDRMVEIAAPESGVPAVLTVFASLASAACNWLDGDLVIELVEDGDATTAVSVMTDLGAGMREKAFAPFVFRVSLAELVDAIDKAPILVGALNVKKVSWRRLLLEANAETRRSTMPPKIGVSDASLWMLDKMVDSKGRTKPPRSTSEPSNTEIDEGWDDSGR
jgi:hypothetical protein